MQTIIGLFNIDNADEAMEVLMETGIREEYISVIAREDIVEDEALDLVDKQVEG